MSAENVAIVRGIYNAFAADDVAGVLGAWRGRRGRPDSDLNKREAGV